jgi:hypothetical protein
MEVPRLQRDTSHRPLLHDGAALHHRVDDQFPHRICQGRLRESAIDFPALLVRRASLGQLCRCCPHPVIEQAHAGPDQLKCAIPR